MKYFLSILLFLFSYNVIAQNHSCHFCQYEAESKSKANKQTVRKIKLEIEQIGLARSKYTSPSATNYQKVLNGVGKDLKTKHSCIDSAFVIQSTYTTDAKAEDYTLVLLLTDAFQNRQLGVHFDKGNGIKMKDVFMASDMVFDFDIPESEPTYTYTEYTGTFYNIYQPSEQIELIWNGSMNSLTLNVESKELYYFRSPDKGLIEPKAYSYELDTDMILIPVNSEELILQYTIGSEQKNFYYKRVPLVVTDED